MKLHNNEKYVKAGITAFLVVVASVIFIVVFTNLRGCYELFLTLTDILSPLLYGFLFAYLMYPIAREVRRRLPPLLGKTKLSPARIQSITRVTSIVIALLVFLACFYALIALIVPNLITSLQELLQSDRLDRYYQSISKWFTKRLSNTFVADWIDFNELLKKFNDWLKSIDLGAFLSSLTSSVFSVVYGVFNILLGIVAALYLLIFKERLTSQAKKITVAVFRPRHADFLFEVARRTNRILGGFFVCKIIDAFIVGIVTYIAMRIMSMPYAPLISFIVGITNIIPFFGPLLGLIPSALLLLIESPPQALYFTIFTLILQQIDGNIIETRLLGQRLGISDFWVLVAVLLFGGIFGFGGMMLGVPIFTLLYSLINDFVNRRLMKRRLPTQTEQYERIVSVDDLPVAPPPARPQYSAEPSYDRNAVDDDADYDDE